MGCVCAEGINIEPQSPSLQKTALNMRPSRLSHRQIVTPKDSAGPFSSNNLLGVLHFKPLFLIPEW